MRVAWWLVLTGSLVACGSTGEDDDSSAVETPEPTATPAPEQPTATPCGLVAWFPDVDHDGWAGNGTCTAEYVVLQCGQPLGYANRCGDCNDVEPTTYPGAVEACDATDSNCDSYRSEGCTVPNQPSPIDFLCLADARFTPSNMTFTAPTGAVSQVSYSQLAAEVLPYTVAVGASPSVSGTPTAETLDEDIAIVQPGGVDGVGTYSLTDGSSTIGCTPLSTMNDMWTIKAVASGNGHQLPRAVALPDGTLFVVVEDWVGVTVSVYQVTPSTRATGGEGILYQSNIAFNANVHPSPDIIRIPKVGGYNYMAGYLTSDDEATVTTVRLRFSQSKDSGASWSLFDSSLTFDVSTIYREQLRLAYDPLSKNMLLGVRENNAGTYTGRYYVSTDLGATWTLLSGASISNCRAHDIKAWNGVFYLATLQDEATDIVRMQRMVAGGSSWTTGVTVHNSTVTNDCLAFEITPDGVFWVDSRDDTLTGNIRRAISTDRGLTWSGDGYFIEEDDAGWASGLKFTGNVYQTGELHLLGNVLSTGTTRDNSVVSLIGGGWSDLTQSADLIPRGYDGYWPSDIPATRSAQHVFTTGGASVESITVDTETEPQLVYDISNDNSTGYITTTMSGAPTEMFGHGARWTLSPDSSGGDLTTDAIAVRIGANTVASGNDVEAGIRINMTARTAQAWDWNAGAALGSATSAWAAGTPVQFWVHVDYLGDGTNSKMTAKYRLVTSRTWTTIVADQTLTRGVGAVLTMRWGKLAASTANVKTISFLPFFRGNGVRTLGDTSPALLGRVATSVPDRTPFGAFLAWRSSPLVAGDTWRLRSRSDHSLALTSPWSLAPSPLRDWRGDAGSAAATYRLAVYDFGSAFVGLLSRNLTWIGWAGLKDVATVRLRRWTGAAWSDAVVASTLVTSFVAGSTGIARSSATTYQFFPRGGTTNANARLWGPDEHRGRWAYLDDGGGNQLAGRILTNSAGQFSGASDSVEATFELDSSTVTAVAGSFAAFSTSTAIGTLNIYGQEGIAIGTATSQSTRYWLLEITMAPGATTPSCGLLTGGTAYPLARPHRAGASISYRTDPRLDRARRVIELPWDALLVPAGAYARTGTGTITGLTQGGAASERANVDNVESVVVGALNRYGALHGQRRGIPVGLVINGDVADDPGNAVQTFTGDDVAFGYMRPFDVTASQGFLIPRSTSRDHSKHGLSLVIDEAALWLPVPT